MKRFRIQPLRDLKATKGFTLVELMFAITIAAIIISIAAPNMHSFILNNRLTSTSTELLRSLQTARTDATKRQQNAVLCMIDDASSTSPTCKTSNFVGWIVFEDTNKNWDHDSSEPILELHTFESDKIKVFADNGALVSYSPTGFRTTNGATSTTTNSSAIVVCDSRGIKDVNGGTTGQSLARGIVITPTGRARVTRVVDSTTDSFDLTDLQSLTGGSC